VFHYERPESYFPLFGWWVELREVVFEETGNSVLEWLNRRIFMPVVFYGGLFPCLVLTSVVILPVVVLSGVKIGKAAP